MRKFLTVSIPIVTIALFICIMLSGSILKKPFGSNDNIPQYIEDIIQAVDKQAWKEASHETEALSRAWNKMIRRVQFSSERDEINSISTNVARLRGAIQAEDKANALMELYEAYSHWKDIGN